MREHLERLARLALGLLPEMHDPATGLFSHKTTLAPGGGYENARPNPEYTAMALAGILEQSLADPDSVVPVGRTLDTLHDASARSSSNVLLGDLLWCAARAGDERAEALVARAAGQDPRGIVSAGLGQLIFGLVRAAEAFPAARDRAHAMAGRCAEELLTRFSPRADLFTDGRLRLDSPRVALEYGLASFATQVYPLHGLAAWFAATGAAADPRLARVADRLVEAQGPLGQWWWIYSPFSRRILEPYPVYSVHQDGMAFMALSPLARIGAGDRSDALARGLEWMGEANELGRSPVLDEPAFICRCIQRRGADADAPFGIAPANFRRLLARSAVPARAPSVAATLPADDVELLRECRSYHLGWVLVAHALVTG